MLNTSYLIIGEPTYRMYDRYATSILKYGVDKNQIGIAILLIDSYFIKRIDIIYWSFVRLKDNKYNIFFSPSYIELSNKLVQYTINGKSCLLYAVEQYYSPSNRIGLIHLNIIEYIIRLYNFRYDNFRYGNDNLIKKSWIYFEKNRVLNKISRSKIKKKNYDTIIRMLCINNPPNIRIFYDNLYNLIFNIKNKYFINAHGTTCSNLNITHNTFNQYSFTLPHNIFIGVFQKSGSMYIENLKIPDLYMIERLYIPGSKILNLELNFELKFENYYIESGIIEYKGNTSYKYKKYQGQTNIFSKNDKLNTLTNISPKPKNISLKDLMESISLKNKDKIYLFLMTVCRTFKKDIHINNDYSSNYNNNTNNNTNNASSTNKVNLNDISILPSKKYINTHNNSKNNSKNNSINNSDYNEIYKLLDEIKSSLI